MSTPFGSTPSQQDQFTLPRGEILGRYESYLDAQKVVDYLADNDFPVANVSIIGCDLKSVERVTAKLSYPRVALSGAAQGAMFGVFVGLLLSLFTTGNPISQLLSSIGLGMAIWMIVGVVGYSLRRGKRDFASSSQIMAGYYDVVVAFEHAQAARNLASSLPMSRVQAGNVTPAWAPRDNSGGATPPAHGTGSAPTAPGTGPGSAASPAAATGSDQPQGPTTQNGTPSRPRSGYEDLPDGRPRFGARLEPETGDTAAGPSAPHTDGESAAGTPSGERQDASASSTDPESAGRGSHEPETDRPSDAEANEPSAGTSETHEPGSGTDRDR
ncbi:general stress protein [Zhihengliuella sp.]|uniref:general stress protein n=1 Tax=Zhihengliuella sp. TaxID=1954483 RepID=UPI0028112A87|nr:general stress protein [Zhihengliuella sp.]